MDQKQKTELPLVVALYRNKMMLYAHSRLLWAELPTVSDSYVAVNCELSMLLLYFQVRGAPAIAIAGTLSVALELKRQDFQDGEVGRQALLRSVTSMFEHLKTARPTAVNITEAAHTFIQRTSEMISTDIGQTNEIRNVIIGEMESMLPDDIATNRAIGKYGAKHILEHCNKFYDKAIVLTHCNTGSLATAGYGTALGVVRALHEMNKLEHVYCTETRPYNQGARLTAYELVQDQLPGTLVCDSMGALLMKERQISAVVVGADRVVSNGDTANKIGTYQLAIVAKHHNIPFYVASPLKTIDFELSSGNQIAIEERPAREMVCIGDRRIAAEGIGVWNPAFDVTPAELITGGVITEKGVCAANYLKSLL